MAADTPACRVLFANQLVIDQRWVWRLSDPFWRLYFNRDSGSAIATAKRRWVMPPYRAVLVPAWSDARGSCTSPVRHFYVHFETPGLPDAWIRRACPDPLLLPEDGVLRDMLDALASEDPGRPGWHLRVQSAAAWALARGLEQVDTTALSDLEAPEADPVVAAALRLIERRLADPLTVAALASGSGLSEDHFARRFHQATGHPVMRWIQSRRITTAADRLIHGGEALEDIAKATGFSNRFHFTRVFTKLIGTPPATYRRQHAGR
jgi:AraC-like DNA-binding protein